MSIFILSFLLHGCIEISAIWRLRLAGLAFALIGSSQLVSSSLISSSDLLTPTVICRKVSSLDLSPQKEWVCRSPLSKVYLKS
jgi:hypothetical protein